MNGIYLHSKDFWKTLNQTMDKTYNQVWERLWEKIEFYRNQFNFDTMNPENPFPADQFLEANPKFKKLIVEVDEELKTGITESQCSYAVMMAYQKESMEEYNKATGKSLEPRP